MVGENEDENILEETYELNHRFVDGVNIRGNRNIMK